MMTERERERDTRLRNSRNKDVVPLPPPVARIVGVDSVAYCAEDWGSAEGSKYSKGRLIYSVFIFIVQVTVRSARSGDSRGPFPSRRESISIYDFREIYGREDEVIAGTP